MSKVIVVDEKADTRIPFLRGMLIKSLQHSGLEFVDAYKLATEIREDLDEQDSITTDELRERIVDALAEDYPDVILARYRKESAYSEAIEVVDRDGQGEPFSRGKFIKRLLGLGIAPELANAVTRHVYGHLVSEQVFEISNRELITLTYHTVRQMGSQRIADSYLVWCDFHRANLPLIILVGGVPGSGKSTIATELANRLSIVRTQSTDMLREVMRALIPRLVAPSLHESSFNAGKSLFRSSMHNENDLDLLTGGYQMQSDMVSVACEAVLKRAVKERVSLILEGVHMRPGLFKQLEKTDAVVVPVILAVLQQKRLKQNFKGRSSQSEKRSAKRYLENFDRIWQLQSAILSDADAADIEIVENVEIDASTTEICRMTTETLCAQYKGRIKALRKEYAGR